MNRAFALACALTALPILTTIALPSTAQAQQELTADAIVDRALATDTIGFQSGAVSMTLLIQDASGETRERNLAIRGRGGDDRSAVVRVTAPAAQAGQAFLFRQNADAEDDVYVFLPAIDSAPRRVSGNQKNGSFMGTHFTYADLESRDIREATYTRLPDETIGEFPVFVIDAVPDDPSQTDYASVRLWVRQSDDIPLRVRFFDEAGETVKTIFTQQTDVSGDRTYVRRLMLSMPDGGSTTMVIENADFDAEVSAAELTPEALTTP